MITESIKALWAKTDNENNWHSLLYHLIDSGKVAEALWKHYLSESFKKNFSTLFELTEVESCNLTSYWVSLHDIGKAGPAFQRKFSSHVEILVRAGYSFPKVLSKEYGYHGLASTWILQNFFQNDLNYPPRFSNALSIILGGHHGEFPSNTDILDSTYKTDHLGDNFWAAQRNEILKILEISFEPPKKITFPREREKLNPILTILAGLTTTADWIASNEKYFPYFNRIFNLDFYIEESEKRARHALIDIGFGGWQADGEPKKFSELFPEFNPNSVQKAFITSVKEIQSPFMLILEAPTGSGKTEAAFYLADQVIQKEKKAGFYIAMPTQATSNQMYERTVSFLSKRYPGSKLDVHLVHGASILSDFIKRTHFSGINQDNSSELSNITSQEWFLPRKRTLLAPFGIGTVDQTFLSVMRSKHFFLRLFGLSHKIIIFDEVHAYDVYMVEIFKRLLSWLRAVNSSVVILSATLPHKSRLELIHAFGGEIDNFSDQKFPRLTTVTPLISKIQTIGNPTNRNIKLIHILDHQIEEVILENCKTGGNIAIICNRIARVQELYERLIKVVSKNSITVFHSRFPYCWRSVIEEKIKTNYGKVENFRPKLSIVIATQVIEQSLDIDFDLLISDLAPIDLLIQRIGRLQRHKNLDILRPENFKQPKMVLIQPLLQTNGMPDFGKDQWVYQKYIMERTYFALKEKSEFVLPKETDILINEVYSEEKSDIIPDHLWESIREDFHLMDNKETDEAIKASNQLIPDFSTNFLGRENTPFSDEHDPQSYSIIQTLTRNSPPSVQIICLLRTRDGVVTLFNQQSIDMEIEPDFETTKSLLKSSLSITNQNLVRILLSAQLHQPWKKSAILRTKLPVIFSDYKAIIGNYLLTLNPEYGLTITSIS